MVRVEALKLIPSVFFDLICRFVPGAVFLVSALALWSTSWQELSAATLGESLSESAASSLLLFLVAGYFVGQLLSEPAKGVQRLGEWVCPPIASRWKEWRKKKEDATDGEDVGGEEDEGESGGGEDGEEMSEEEKKMKEEAEENKKKRQAVLAVMDGGDSYDYLRTWRQDLGDQCAKIRAEFTMHDSLAAVFLLLAAIYTVREFVGPQPEVEWNRWIVGVLVIGAIVEFHRGWTTNGTFKSTGNKFVLSLQKGPPPERPRPKGEHSEES